MGLRAQRLTVQLLPSGAAGKVVGEQGWGEWSQHGQAGDVEKHDGVEAPGTTGPELLGKAGLELDKA